MISICIPVFNFDVRALVGKLSDQLKSANFEGEIVIIDDCSTTEFKAINKSVCVQQTYVELKENVGRSKIRNLFLKYTKYDNLLFLDCDGIVIHENFISNYTLFIENKEYNVVCGGRIYDTNSVKRKHKLRWKYGLKKESQPLDVRLQAPNKSFMTNNFLIRRSLFEQIRFEERINKYGHEDTLFGYMLKQKGLNIDHIDNPILNGDIETNALYLNKTEEGLANLVYIIKYQDYDNDFMEDVSILDFYQNLKSRKQDGVVYFFYKLFGPIIRYLLLKGFVNLKLFQFYKLGFMMHSFKTITI